MSARTIITSTTATRKTFTIGNNFDSSEVKRYEPCIPPGGVMVKKSLETGELFGKLFAAYDEDNFLKSVHLFKDRFEDNGFDITYFKDKKCLDLGCGGGRYSTALSLLGAKTISGIDISEESISNATQRAQQFDIENVTFQVASGEKLPFDEEEFDCVICSGVLMHTADPEKLISETARVLKKGGMVYLLVYATEGVRWPLINILRNITAVLGFNELDAILAESGLDVNKRRTYLDDLFVPRIDFYSDERLRKLLQSKGFSQIDRWKKGRLDHEESIEDYLADLKKLEHLFQTGCSGIKKQTVKEKTLFKASYQICKGVVQYVEDIKNLIDSGEIDRQSGEHMVIGQGHHRMTAIKV